MQTEAAIERVAAEAVVDLAVDGVVYAEIRFAPELHTAMHTGGGGPRRHGRDASRRGRGRAGRSPDLDVRHLLRDAHGRPLAEIAHLVDDVRTRDDKVVAFDLAGDETGYPPSRHAAALAFARQRHLNVTIHASEPPDLELIDDAIVHGAHRIGHGVRLARDTSPDPDAPGGLRLGALAQYVLDRQIHLELAPTCNVQIGAVERLADHPIGPFLRAGFSVGVNTDNRLMSGVMPSSELAAVTDAFDLDWHEVEQLAVHAVEAGFAPYEERRRILEDVRPAVLLTPGAAADPLRQARSANRSLTRSLHRLRIDQRTCRPDRRPSALP